MGEAFASLEWLERCRVVSDLDYTDHTTITVTTTTIIVITTLTQYIECLIFNQFIAGFNGQFPFNI